MKKVEQKDLSKLLKSRKLEDPKKIKYLEKILLDGRGFIFKMPKKGSNVVLLASGGLDSMVAWGILMKDYGLNVYPVTFNRGEKRRSKEFKAFKYFDELYKKSFPKQYRNFINLNVGQKQISIGIENGLEKLSEESILSSFQDGEIQFNAALGFFTILPLYGLMYAQYLNAKTDLKIDTIFCAVTADDGELVPHQTLTSLRSIMTNMCVSINDYSWQFSSICLEPEINSFMKKSDLIKWGKKNNLPLEKTWSCYHSKKFQCGGNDCITCKLRRAAFAEAKVKDQTKYVELEKQTLSIKLLKRYTKKIISMLKKYV